MVLKNLFTRFKLKKDTASKWNTNNPVLLDGEPGVEVDGDKVKAKIGDGTTPWKSLPYLRGDESALAEMVNVGRKNIAQLNDYSGNGVVQVIAESEESNIPVGTYVISFKRLSTNAATLPLLTFHSGAITSAGSIALTPGENGVAVLTTTRAATGVRILAGSTVLDSARYELAFEDLMICKKELYDVDPSYQPYSLSNPDLTAGINDIAENIYDLEDKLTDATLLIDRLPIENGGTGKTNALGAITALGGASIAERGIAIPNGSDINTYIEPGTYYTSGSANSAQVANSPTTGAGYKLFVMQAYSNNYRTHLAIAGAVNAMYIRTTSDKGESWTDWKQFAFTTIVDKYLPLTGGEVSGNIEASGGFTGVLKGRVETMVGKTILDIRATLDEVASNSSGSVGTFGIATFNMAASWTTLWNSEDTSGTLSSGQRWTFSLIGSYSNSTYSVWLISSYASSGVLYFVSKNNGTWGKVRKILMED